MFEAMPPRLPYLDWLRGLALLGMLLGHTFHSWVRDEQRASDLFQVSQMIGGFPAALFLFLTGISLVILLDRQARSGGAERDLWAVILRRSGYILVVAYLFRLQQWAMWWPNPHYQGIFKPDILNALGVALALSGAVMLLVPKHLRLAAAAGGAAFCAIITPLAWSLPADLLPVPILGYIRGFPELLNFPVFPWASYTFTGVLAGMVVVGKEPAQVDRAMQWFVLIALTLLIAARFFDALPYTYYHPYDYWNTSPNLVANKTAVVLLLFAASYAWTSVADLSHFSWVRQIGRTSLLIYWVHIEIVYGRFFHAWQHQLTLGQTATGLACLTAAMLLLSVAKTRWTARRKAAARVAVPPPKGAVPAQS
jgi:uncharacterized membrane protein